MRVPSLGLKRLVWALTASVLLSRALPAVGQSPPDPGPPAQADSPAATPAGDAPAQLEERLRKMEAVNQRLLEQVESISQQNVRLTRQVEALTKRLESTNGATSAGGPAVGPGAELERLGAGWASSAPALSEDAARPSRSPVGPPPPTEGTNVAAAPRPVAGGADVTAPSVSEDAARPSRIPGGGAPVPSDRVRLGGFYDQQRYGFLFQSVDEEFELRVNSLLQLDALIYSNQHMSPVSSNVDIPRARLYFSGRMTRPIEYQVSFQRGPNTLDLLNAYINLHYDDRLQLRFGRYKPPYTFEWFKASIWELPTPDRSPFGLNFGPNRMVGGMAWGFLFDERLEYAVGVFDGPRNSYQDTNYAKDVMALFDYKPFYRAGIPALKNFALGGSFDHGRQNNPLAPSVLRTSTPTSTSALSSTSGDNLISVPFLAFNSNVREKGDRSLGELYTTYFYKGLSLLGVWDFGNNDFALSSGGALPVHVPVSGFFVQAAYLVTGESRERLGLIAPLHPFDIRKGKRGPGALELQARYSTLNIGNQVFTGGLADPNLWANRIELIDAGFNWYLNKYTKFYFDWEYAIFNQPVYDRPGGFQSTNSLFWLRLQIYL
jgi:phosphate-selective porin OprO/OprP